MTHSGERGTCDWCRQDGCTPENDADCPCPHHDQTHPSDDSETPMRAPLGYYHGPSDPHERTVECDQWPKCEPDVEWLAAQDFGSSEP